MKKLMFLCFAICISGSLFSQSFKDCDDAYYLCEKATYKFENIKGYGQTNEPIAKAECFDEVPFKETNSIWLKWVISDPGTLSFTISPEVNSDDIDFILYKISDDCNNAVAIRCMGSGSTIGGNLETNQNCLGATGLKVDSYDTFESNGCKYNDDNFLKFLKAEEGEHYALLINNYDSEDGFTITFEGTAILEKSQSCSISNVKEDLIINEVYPNPADDLLNIVLDAKQSENVTIQVVSITGEIVLSESNMVLSGNNLLSLDITNLPSSTYVLILQNNGFSTTKSFIKK